MNNDLENFLASFSFAETTKETYRRILIKLPPSENMDAADLLKFISKPEWGNSQRYVALCACRKFIAYLFGSNHPALSARIKRIKSKPQRTLTTNQALKLLASFNTHQAKGARDLSIAALALDTGLRLAELCRLRIKDIDLENRTLQIIVKGGQWKAAVFSPQTAQYIREWLVFRKSNADEIFTSTRTGNRLTREGLQTIVKKWGKGIEIKLSPHDLRRSFATLATIFGAPSRIVQAAGRWSNIEMVEHYTQGLNIDAIEPYFPVSRLTK